MPLAARMPATPPTRRATGINVDGAANNRYIISGFWNNNLHGNVTGGSSSDSQRIGSPTRFVSQNIILWMSDTTLASLQQALAPKTGMQRIPLTLDSYQHQSAPLTSRLLLNTYAEQLPPAGQGMARVDAALLPTPGLVPTEVLGDGLGAGPIHVMNDARPGNHPTASAVNASVSTELWQRRPVGLD